MCGDRFSSSTTCSRCRHETEPGRLDQSLSCRFWKVATHPYAVPAFVTAPEARRVHRAPRHTDLPPRPHSTPGDPLGVPRSCTSTCEHGSYLDTPTPREKTQPDATRESAAHEAARESRAGPYLAPSIRGAHSGVGGFAVLSRQSDVLPTSATCLSSGALAREWRRRVVALQDAGGARARPRSGLTT